MNDRHVHGFICFISRVFLFVILVGGMGIFSIMQLMKTRIVRMDLVYVQLVIFDSGFWTEWILSMGCLSFGIRFSYQVLGT